METSGVLVTGVAIGAPLTAVVAVARAVVVGRRVPMAAVAVLAAIVPAAGVLVGLYVVLGVSEAAGEWIMRACSAGLLLAAATFVLALAVPERRRLAKALCVLVVATVVPVTTLLVVAQTAAGRHADWAEHFPAAGTARLATADERGYVVRIEYQVAARTFERPGIGCDELPARLAAHAGVDVSQVGPANELAAPDGSCSVETETAWRGSQATLTRDGRLVVAAWSPTADLFVF